MTSLTSEEINRLHADLIDTFVEFKQLENSMRQLMYRVTHKYNECVPEVCVVIGDKSKNEEPIVTRDDKVALIYNWNELYDNYDDCLEACDNE